MNKIPPVKLTLVNKANICIMVTLPGTTIRKFKNLDIKIDASQWDGKNQIIKKAHTNAGKLNAEIWAERTKIEDAFKVDNSKGVVFTASHIEKRLLFEYSDPAKDFYTFALEQIAIKKYSSETRRTYNSEVSKMEQYSPLLSFGDITYSWLQLWEQYMRETLKNHPNTIWKSLKFLNTFLNVAIATGGIIKENPFDKYDRGSYEQGIPQYIEWDEAQKIHSEVKGKDLSDQLKQIGHYALLSYYTGLRFSDAIKFDYSKKVTQDTTGRRLVLYAQKNGQIVSIKFNKYIAEVVDYIKDHPLSITNQEYNASLKILCASSKVYKDVSSHDFRHGFGMRCAELEIHIEEVQRLMGHKKRSSTEIYYRIKNARLDNSMKAWE